jgi:CRP/FNR family transcriptional regulator
MFDIADTQTVPSSIFVPAGRAGKRPAFGIAGNAGVPLTLAPGEAVFIEGDPAENFYEVLSGTVRLHKLLPDGRRQITGFLSTGHLLGLSHANAYVYSAEAVGPVMVLCYPRARLDRLMDEVPGLARRLLAAASDELRQAQDQMLLLGRKTAAEKMASFLVTLVALQGDDADELELPMSRNDIADYLGLTMETVSRTLAKLKRDRLIALSTHTRVELLDRDRLEELAAGELGPQC